MLKGRDSIMTTGGNARSSPMSAHQSLSSTLKEHRDLMADYHQQLQQLQQQQGQQQQSRHLRRPDPKGRHSPRSSDDSASPPESPIHDADQTSDLDEFMESDNEDTGVALDLVSLLCILFAVLCSKCEAHAYPPPPPFSVAYLHEECSYSSPYSPLWSSPWSVCVAERENGTRMPKRITVGPVMAESGCVCC